jgi:hypothetical protein
MPNRNVPQLKAWSAAKRIVALTQGLKPQNRNSDEVPVPAISEPPSTVQWRKAVSNPEWRQRSGHPPDDARKALAAAGSTDKQLRIFTVAQGGAEHVQADQPDQARQLVADWVAERLGHKTR